MPSGLLETPTQLAYYVPTSLPRIKLTTTCVRELEHPEVGQVIYFDTKLSGFGLRVGRSKKTYFAEKRVDRRTRRVTIGPADLYGCEQARREAQRAMGQMASGIDPNAERAERRVATLTLEDAASEFFAMRSLADRTAYNYRLMLRMAFGDWLPRPMKDINGDMVLRRFREVTERNGPAYANHSTRAFRSIWNFARARFRFPDGGYLLPENPAQRISEARMWNRVEPRKTLIKRSALPAWHKAVTELESDAYSEAAEAVRDYLLLLLFTGLRKSEAAELRWGGDVHKDRLHIPVTKNGRPFDLPILPVHHAILEPLRRLDPVWVFPARRSATGHLKNPKRIPWLPHAHRRTFATVAMEAGVIEEVVGRLLNHTPLSITGHRYVRPSLDAPRPAMVTICSALKRRTR